MVHCLVAKDAISFGGQNVVLEWQVLPPFNCFLNASPQRMLVATRWLHFGFGRSLRELNAGFAGISLRRNEVGEAT